MRLSEIKYQTGYTIDPRFSASDEPDDDTTGDDADDDASVFIADDLDTGLVDANVALNSPSAYGFIIPGATSSGRWSSTAIKRYCAPGDTNCNPNRPHLGVDFNTTGNDAGREIVAPAAGTIEFARLDGACGNTVKINHGDDGITRYCHLSGFASGISSNVRVNAGQVIGYVGSTGRSSGPHLHFETYDLNNNNIDPITWLSDNATYFPLKSGT